MKLLELLLGLVAFAVALGVLAQRIKIPMAVPLVLGGMLLALIPGLPALELDPELALALFLPPLLQASAYRTDWPAFRSNLRPILLLAIGAVFFTALAVAGIAKLMVPGLPWWAAVALGAIVAPPDAVAAGSVLKKFHLPKRLVVVLEGESLVNDASSLVLYRFAVGAVLGGTASYGSGALLFVGAAVGGTAIGWLVGRMAMWVFARIDDTLLDITVSILSGFAAYLLAEALHVSGVLAAVACGLLLGRQQHAEFTAKTRLELHAVWEFLEFLLAALLFMLIGLQLRGIVERLIEHDKWGLMALGLAVSATLIVSRFVWIFSTTWLERVVSRRIRSADPMPSAASLAVLSWAGMRGVVSLAAALALPARFPGRDLIVFLAFCAIFTTLVLQGTTLGWLVHKLKVIEAESAAPEPEEAAARAEIADAALGAVRSQVGDDGSPEYSEAAAQLIEEYETRFERANSDDPQSMADERQARLRLRLVAIDAARARLKDHTTHVDTRIHRALLEELDLEEQQVRNALGEQAQRDPPPSDGHDTHPL
jgi:CPA1 family monovalent cation:H+ antiporter